MIFGRIKLIAIAAAVLAAAIGIWRVVDLIGDAREVKAIETVNQEGRDAADAIAEARQRVRACHAAGRLWNRATGECGAAVPVPR